MRSKRSEIETAAHRDNAILHAIRRARLRLDVTLSEMDVMHHGMLIWAGQSSRLGFGAIKRELHSVQDGDRCFLAVWDKDLRRIVTYLAAPEEWKGTLTPAGRSLQMSRLPATGRTNGFHGHAIAR